MKNFSVKESVTPVLASAILGFLMAGAAHAQTNLTQSSQSSNPIIGLNDLEPTAGLEGDDAGLDQVTSVSQLTDVKPTDWAFQALQSLVERYGCIVGYPDKTFRGNRALSRYEFAAGLNACLDKIQELIAAGTANLATREDLEKLKKMMEGLCRRAISPAGTN